MSGQTAGVWQSFPYTVVRSRRKTLALQVGADGALTVRAPFGCPQREIDALLDRHGEWIRKTVRRQRDRALRYPPLTEAETAALRARAKAEIPPKVARYAALMGVRPTGVRITAAKKRFGSCSGKNALCFSLYLMRYPEPAVDYVVVHELAHIRHHDHSPAFWAEVARYMPDYAARRALLE